MKTGVKNDIFWSEIGSRFGEPGGTPPPRVPRSTPPGSSTFVDMNTKHGLPVQGPPLWSLVHGPLRGPRPWTTPVDHHKLLKMNFPEV